MADVQKPNPRAAIKMRVDEIRDYNPQIRELFLKSEAPFNFRAGQFCMLNVPTGGPKPAQRAYSFASTDERKDGFRLIFKYVPTGLASEYVWKLRAGDMIDVTGPWGRLFFKEPPTEQIVMLNTGSGVSQHFCFLESNIKKHPNLKYRLLFGVRTEDDIYYKEELERLKKQLPNFEYWYVLSRSPSWPGRKGYVQNHIREFEYMSIPTTFYLCGNGAMIKDTKETLAADGFDASKVFAEAFD